MEVLIVSPWLPHPGIRHAGGQHLFHTVRALAERGHRLHLLCYGRGESQAEQSALAAHCASLTVLHPAYGWRQKFAGLLRDGWRQPWLLGHRTHHAARAHIRALCTAHPVDVVHLAWTEMGRYLDAVPANVGRVLGTLDVEYRVRPCEVAGWARIQAGWRAQRLIAIERHAVPRADVVLACSPADRDALAHLGPAEPAHVVAPWFEPLPTQPSDAIVPGRLTFLGALDRQANRAATRWLLESVWPLVRAADPVATLHIVGANPPDNLRRAAARDPRLTVPGFVPDLAQIWAATDVAVAPSLVGGGLLIKVAQPMSAGRPVVTTSPGNEGVGALPGHAVEVADDAQAFAAAVLRLRRDRAHWARIAAGGRDHVAVALDWATSLDALEAAYHRAHERAVGTRRIGTV